MAFSEFEIKRIQTIMDRYLEIIKPPIDLRIEQDFAYKIVGQSVTLFELTPKWDDALIILGIPIAKATYIKNKQHWKIYWQRQDMKWHAYKPQATSPNIDGFIKIISADRYRCFFG